MLAWAEGAGAEGDGDRDRDRMRRGVKAKAKEVRRSQQREVCAGRVRSLYAAYSIRRARDNKGEEMMTGETERERGEIAASRRDGIGNDWEERGRARAGMRTRRAGPGVEASKRGTDRDRARDARTRGQRKATHDGDPIGRAQWLRCAGGCRRVEPSAVERVRDALLCDALRCATRRGDATGAMGTMTFTFERKAGEGRNLNWTHTRRRAGSWRLSLVGARRDGDAGSV